MATSNFRIQVRVYDSTIDIRKIGTRRVHVVSLVLNQLTREPGKNLKEMLVHNPSPKKKKCRNACCYRQAENTLYTKF